MRTHELLRSRWVLAVLPVLLVAVVAACGSSGSSGSSSGASSTPTAMPTSAAGAGGAASSATVDISNFAYKPQTVTVTVGATVTWVNKDSVVHDVTSVNGPGVNATKTGLFASPNFNPGQSFSFKFTKAGTYHYECLIHKAIPAMHGVVYVK